MTIEHSSLTDPQIHEPKGAATASSGQAYIADGLGSGSFQSVPLTSDFSFNNAAMVVENNTTAVALSAATDSTLKTDSDYVKYSQSVVTGVIVGDDVTFSTDSLTIGADGTYEIEVSLTSEYVSATLPTKVAFAISTDGTNASLLPMKCEQTFSASGDSEAVTFKTSVALVDGDTVSLFVAGKDAGNLTVVYAHVSASRLFEV